MSDIPHVFEVDDILRVLQAISRRSGEKSIKPGGPFSFSHTDLFNLTRPVKLSLILFNRGQLRPAARGVLPRRVKFTENCLDQKSVNDRSFP